MTFSFRTPIRPKDRFLVFGAPTIEDAEIQEVVATMKSGWLGTGPKVAEFEKRFAACKGVPHTALNFCHARAARTLGESSS
jgi:dTDP-4-amino-4,6-dideoxygalactose transaminase